MTSIVRTCLSLAAALLLVGTQVATAVHYFGQRHATCVEHGDLVHAEAAAVVFDDGGAMVTGTAGDVDHDHHHCAACDTVRAGVAWLSRPLVAVESSFAQPGGGPPTLRAAACAVTYRLAPKTSPPPCG